MKLMLEEQEKLLGSFNNPKDFISAYIDVYITQINIPIKIYLNDIPYYNNFEASFLDFVLSQAISENSEEIEFIKIEKILQKFKDGKIFDKIFYDQCCFILIKGIAVLVDKIEQNIRKQKYDEINFLYYYTDVNINLIDLLASTCEKYLKNIEKLIKKMTDLKAIVEKINNKIKNIGKSTFASDERLKNRIVISEILIGEKNIMKYDVIEIYLKIFDYIMLEAKSMEGNEGYMYIMEFCSNFITENLGNENDICKLKEFAVGLIEDVK